MKKSNKIIVKTFSIMMMLLVVFSIGVPAFADIKPELPADTTNGAKITKATDLGNKVWNTASVIIQIVAIGAIVFAGVRYMFASANDKADIKKQTVILVVGAALVFAAVPIAKFIANTAIEIFK